MSAPGPVVLDNQIARMAGFVVFLSHLKPHVVSLPFYPGTSPSGETSPAGGSTRGAGFLGPIVGPRGGIPDLHLGLAARPAGKIKQAMTIGAEGEAAIPEAVTRRRRSTPVVFRVSTSRPPARSHSFTSATCIGNEASEASRRPSGLNASLQIMLAMTGERAPLPAAGGVEHFDHSGVAHVPPSSAAASSVPSPL